MNTIRDNAFDGFVTVELYTYENAAAEAAIEAFEYLRQWKREIGKKLEIKGSRFGNSKVPGRYRSYKIPGLFRNKVQDSGQEWHLRNVNINILRDWGDNYDSNEIH